VGRLDAADVRRPQRGRRARRRPRVLRLHRRARRRARGDPDRRLRQHAARVRG
jgi:hypothetical protein